MSRLAGSSTGDEHGEAVRHDDGVGADERVWRPAPWKTPVMSFGQRLKAQRERRGIALDVIADAYKINRSLLADLERDDLSKWPEGVFGRGFVRAYATAIGLAPGPILAEFVSIYPDTGDSAGKAARPAGENDLRLTLAGDPRAALASAASRAYAAVFEAALLLVAGYAVSRVTALSTWSLASAIGFVYYPTAAACLGRIPSQWWMERRRSRAQRTSDRAPDSGPRRALQLIVSRTELAEPDDSSSALNLNR